ncbi:spermidine synthase [Chondromyces crocatus]|uniref:spermidine synthase n=1 Tax=Chondromyces crocatus TaxID=52 RepID=UPI0012E24BCC|nr:fused MFS/spermidine synthase [Chondromyces crocatus]
MLAYPFVLEPWLGLTAQARAWAWGYGLFVFLLAACAHRVIRRHPGAPNASATAETDAPDAPDETASEREIPPRPLLWLALAFVPSSHLLGVTAYVTTDIAPIPLLWAVPLALYLTSFILVFARRPTIPHAWMVRLLPLGAAASILTLIAETSDPPALLLPLHLLTFFAGAMVCHGELARSRPGRRHLTAFYLCLGAGGALGGLLNAVLAPLLFNSLVEYPLAILLACLCRPAPASDPTASPSFEPDHEHATSIPPEPEREATTSAPSASEHDIARCVPSAPRLDTSEETPALTAAWQGPWRPDLLFAARAGLLTVALILGARFLDRPHDRLTIGVVFCIPLLFVYRTLYTPRRFALSLGAIALASALHPGGHGADLHRERTFFGVVRVTQDSRGFHRLVHGRTMHGVQSFVPSRRREPLAYYTLDSPIGRTFTRLDRAAASSATIGVVGLGAGALAVYARPGQRWTFYEIDPAVARIARDPRYFTFLHDAFPEDRGLHLVIGDARLGLTAAPDAHFDLLILDAFSSDAIPVHLLTREALALYERKLAPGGVIAFHLSNRFLDLFPALGNLVTDAGLIAYGFQDAPTRSQEQAGKSPSRWALVARHIDDLQSLPHLPDAWKLRPRPDVASWTDDVSDLLALLRR